jgi:hypothetical protein
MKITCSEEGAQFLGEQVFIVFSQHSNFVEKIIEIVKIKEKEFSQPTSKKRGRPANVSGKIKKTKEGSCQKGRIFSKLNEEKKNGHNWKHFEVDTLIARREKC